MNYPMDRRLLDKPRYYTIINYWSKHFFPSLKNSFKMGTCQGMYMPIPIYLQ